MCVGCTYDTIVIIRKDLNRVRSNPTTVKDTLGGQIKSLSSQLDIARKAACSLNYPDSVKQLLRRLFRQLNDGRWKENLGISDIKFAENRLESLLSERKSRLTNLDNKKAFGSENRLFELSRASFYRSVFVD